MEKKWFAQQFIKGLFVITGLFSTLRPCADCENQLILTPRRFVLFFFVLVFYAYRCALPQIQDPGNDPDK